MKIIKDKFLLLLVGFYLIYLLLHLHLYNINQQFHTIDAPNHAMFCLELYRDFNRAFKDPNLSLVSKLKQAYLFFRKGIIYWPKFVYLSSFPFLYLRGVSLNSIKYANLIYLFILMLFSYLLSYKINRDKLTALLTAGILPALPILLEAIQGYGLDFPLTAGLVMFFYLLLKTDYFTKSSYSLYSGIVLGVLWLIKGQTAIFTTVPILWMLLKGIRKTTKDREDIKLFLVMANFCLLVIISYGIGSIHWHGEYLEISDALKKHIVSKTKYLESYPWEEYKSLAYYAYYFKYLYLDGLGPVLFLILVFFNYLFFRKKNQDFKIIFLFWIFVPLILFSFLFEVKQLRFIMPIIPPLFISGGMGLDRGRKYKFIGWLLIISIVFLQLFPLQRIPSKVRKSFFSQKINIRDWQQDNPNLGLAQACLNSIQKKLSPGNYKLIIFRYLPLVDGPLSLQFWIELLGYKRGYIFSTHDFLDQRYSVYSWLQKQTPETFVFVFLDKKNIELQNFFNKNMILENIRNSLDWYPWYQECKNEPLFLELIEQILPKIKKNFIYLADFRYLEYRGKIYKYEKDRDI